MEDVQEENNVPMVDPNQL